MHQLDAFRCAKMLLDRHGQHAAVIQAAFRADELAAAGDQAGHRAWMMILATIEDLGRTERLASESFQ